MAPSSRPLARLLRYAAPHHARVRLAALYSVLNRIFDLAPPLLIGAAVDIVVRREESVVAGLGFESPASQLTVLALATVSIWILESLFEYLEKVGWRNLAQTVQHELRLDAYEHIQGLETAFFEDQSTGGLMSVLNDDVNQLERFLDRGANDLIQTATSMLVIGATFFWLAPTVAWMAVLPMPFVLWGSVAFQKRLAPRYATVREEVGQLNADLAGNLGGIATIKSFTAEAREIERIQARSDNYRRANSQAIRLSSAFSPLIRMVILVGFTGTLLFGGWMALDGEIEAGSYSTMVFMTQRLLWPLTDLGNTFDLYQRAMASTARVLDLLDLTPAIQSGTRALRIGPGQGIVRFQDVSFGYVAAAPIFDGLDIDAPAGQTTAIVGATGSGKSTLVKLLLRFYDTNAGAVRVDGTDVREFTLDSLRGAIGLVSQDVFLFHGSVRDNIAYGRPDATDADIEQAARAAEAHQFIAALPNGYETIVGERGQKLSGGQRQRISLARAVLKDPAILVLDEATSAVDNETEAAIQRSLDRIAVGRTTLVIAHRLSTIRNAQQIVVLDEGRVVERGTHDELVARGGAYASLWRVQTGERAPASPSK